MFTKQQAMARVNEHLGSRILTTKNTCFSNINKAVDVWWFNIPLSKFDNDLNLLLNKTNGFFWLIISADTFTNLNKIFKIRQDKQCVDLEISSNRNNRYMTDIHSGQVFSPYIQYEFNQMLGLCRVLRYSLIYRGVQNKPQ